MPGTTPEDQAMDEKPTGAAARMQHLAKRTLDVAQAGLAKIESKRFERTPAGRAHEAYLRGDTVFQYREQVKPEGHGEVLSSIEAEGWTLQDTQFTTESTQTTDTEGNSESQTTNHAIYLFRRSDTEAPSDVPT